MRISAFPSSVRHSASWIALFCWVLSFTRAAAADDGGLEFFEKRIRPVLVERCFKCHSSEAAKAKGGLRLDRKASVVEGGDSGTAVVPGKPEESLLIKAIQWTGVVSEMPPDSKLPDQVIADFREWVRLGAAFPADTAPAGG